MLNVSDVWKFYLLKFSTSINDMALYQDNMVVTVVGYAGFESQSAKH